MAFPGSRGMVIRQVVLITIFVILLLFLLFSNAFGGALKYLSSGEWLERIRLVG